MIVRVSDTQFIRMYTSTAITENSMEITQKIKNSLSHAIAISVQNTYS